MVFGFLFQVLIAAAVGSALGIASVWSAVASRGRFALPLAGVLAGLAAAMPEAFLLYMSAPKLVCEGIPEDPACVAVSSQIFGGYRSLLMGAFLTATVAALTLALGLSAVLGRAVPAPWDLLRRDAPALVLACVLWFAFFWFLLPVLPLNGDFVSAVLPGLFIALMGAVLLGYFVWAALSPNPDESDESAHHGATLAALAALAGAALALAALSVLTVQGYSTQPYAEAAQQALTRGDYYEGLSFYGWWGSSLLAVFCYLPEVAIALFAGLTRRPWLFVTVAVASAVVNLTVMMPLSGLMGIDAFLQPYVGGAYVLAFWRGFALEVALLLALSLIVSGLLVTNRRLGRVEGLVLVAVFAVYMALLANLPRHVTAEMLAQAGFAVGGF